MQFFARAALLPEGWARDVSLGVHHDGTISSVTADSSAVPGAVHVDALLPAMPNAHSHAFQRALAGTVQRGSHAADSFWSWRDAMYALANGLRPERYEELAFETFARLRAGGYGSVAEFHYVHADPQGRRYADIAEMSERVVAAAKRAGLALTLLPALYLHANFGEPLAAEQRRFSLGLEGYLELWRTLHDRYRDDPAVRIGFAPHSLRAVAVAELRTALEAVRAIDATVPVHIHIAEQIREVEDCRAVSGRSPVTYLFEEVDVDEHWCLVHATHADRSEREAIARSGAVVALCPSTEADLGDGIFGARHYIECGGRFAIGSDANVRTGVVEELRWLEYGQRLLLQRRAVLCSAAIPSTGEFLYRGALAGGAAALGLPATLERGQLANMTALHVAGDIEPARLLDAFVFAEGAASIAATWHRGSVV